MKSEAENNIWSYKPRTPEEIKLAQLYVIREEYIKQMQENIILLRTWKRLRGDSKKENDMSYTNEITRAEGLNLTATVILEEIEKEIKELKSGKRTNT